MTFTIKKGFKFSMGPIRYQVYKQMTDVGLKCSQGYNGRTDKQTIVLLHLFINLLARDYGKRFSKQIR